MNRVELGRVLAFLLRYRRLETLPKGRPRQDERELARMLKDASTDSRNDLEGVLKGVGFDLVHFDGFSVHGLSPGGEVFMIVRRLEDVSPLFSEQAIDERMHVRGDTVTTRRIWFTQLWFVLNFMFYTRITRGPSEVARYAETNFTRADLVRVMREYINDLVRKLGKDGVASDAVYACLCAESGAQVDKYAERFLDLMSDSALVDELGGGRYQQSLLGAVEMKNNHLQGLEPWIQSVGTGADPGPLETGRQSLVRVVDSSEV